MIKQNKFTMDGIIKQLLMMDNDDNLFEVVLVYNDWMGTPREPISITKGSCCYSIRLTRVYSYCINSP